MLASAQELFCNPEMSQSYTNMCVNSFLGLSADNLNANSLEPDKTQ